MSDSTPEATPEEQTRTRPPVWVLVVGVVALVAVVAVVVALLTGREEPGPPPEPEVVTLPAPTPTLDPIEREEGTALYEALPSTVLAFVLSSSEPDDEVLAERALEGYRLGYTDGSQDLVVRVAQWADADGASAALTDRVPAGEDGAAEDGAAEDGAVEDGTAEDGTAEQGAERTVDEGAVEVDGEVVGRYVIESRADGTATAWWTNGTVLVEVEGPADAVRDVYTAYPL